MTRLLGGVDRLPVQRELSACVAPEVSVLAIVKLLLLFMAIGEDALGTPRANTNKLALKAVLPD